MLSASTQAILVALSAAAPSTSAQAIGEERPDEQIVVTATRTGQPLAGSVSIVGREEIERRDSVSLLDVLTDVAGVRAFSTGGVGGRSFLSIRGGEPNFTLVLLEGMKLNDPTNSRGGGFDFFAIDPALVERLEVTRGAASSVHGSDALSGAVNIRLRDPVAGEASASARAEIGSEGDGGVTGSLAHGWRGGGALVAGSWYDSGGIHDGSRLSREQALARLRQAAGPVEASLILLYGHASRAAYPEDSGGPRLAVIRALERGESELRAIGLNLHGTAQSRLEPHLSLSWSRQDDEAATPAIAPGVLDGTPAITSDSRFSRAEAIADLRYTSRRVTASAGLAWLDEDGRSRGTIDFGFPLPVAFDLERRTRSLFAETVLHPGAGITFDFAGRHDQVASGPGAWTGRAGASWQAGPSGPLLFARIGEGYKLPSFYALSHPLIGNPALRPERSVNLEAGVEQSLGKDQQLRLTVFRNRFRDLIDFDPATFKTVNRDRVRASGVELEGAWAPAPAVRLSGALTWLDLDSPTPLRGRPKWQAMAAARWLPTARLELSARLAANSWFHDSSIPTGAVRADGHVEFDLGLLYRLSRKLDLRATLKNLGSSRYEDAVGFPAPGTQLRVTLAAGLF
jgi:outer membrane cobalamin receptor